MKTYTPEQRLARVITGGIFPSKLNITSPDGNDTGYLELDSVTATALAAWIAERFPCAFSAAIDIALHGEAAIAGSRKHDAIQQENTPA